MAGKGDSIKKLLANLPGASPGKAKGKEGEGTGKTNKLLGKMMEKIGGKGAMPGGAAGGGDRKQFRKTVNAVVTSFDKQALRQLGIGAKKDDAKPADDTKTMPKKLPPWWKKLLGPALLILGGLAAFVYGLLTDGPLKGLMKLLAKGGIQGGLKWLGNIIGGVIKKLKKTLRGFLKLTGLSKMFKAVKGAVVKAFKPISNFFKKTIPNFFKKMFKPLTSLFKSSGKGFLSKILQFIVKWGGKALKLFKPIPVIGGLISFFFAWSRFKKGDIAGGVLEILSGIASFFPGIGTAISIGIDILLAVMDIKGGGSDVAGGKAKPKGAMLLNWGKKIWGFIKKLPPFSNIIHFYKGFTSVFDGKWSDAARHFMFAIPMIGNVLELIMGKGEEPQQESPPGDKSGFFSNIYNWMISHWPIRNLLQMWGGIKTVFSGDIFGGFLDIAYAIPFFGSIVKFFGGPETSEEAEEAGSRGGLWGIVKDYINNLYPISNILHIWKGLKAIFRMDWAVAAEHFMFAIPLVGNVLGFFAGSAPAEKGAQEKAPSIWQKIKQGVMNKFKPAWKAMPKFVRWMARKILPDSILSQLDNPGPEYHDKLDSPHSGQPEADPKPQNPYAAALKSVIGKFKPVWGIMPGWLRWVARKVLPDVLVSMLDEKDPAGDVQLTGQPPGAGKPVNVWASVKRSLIDKFRGVWKWMPPFMKWIAKRVLPTPLIDLLEGKGGDEKDDFGGNKSPGADLAKGADTLSKGMSISSKMMMSAGRRLMTQTQILLRSLQFALKPGFGFVKSLTGLIRQQRPKMPVSEPWQRRAITETRLKATPDQTPIPVRVIEPVQLKKDGEGGPNALADNAHHLATLPSLLNEFQQSTVDGRTTVLGALQQIDKTLKDMPIPGLVGGGGGPGGAASGPGHQRRNWAP